MLASVPMTACAQDSAAPWLTRAFDDARSGWNPRESRLTAPVIKAKGIVRFQTVALPGDARGVEAQPLVLPGVDTAKGRRDVLVLATMANKVVAVDAHDGTPIWQITLGPPVRGSATIDMHQINDHWGCLSTGVIDAELKRLFQACWIASDDGGDFKSARWRLFVLDVADGHQVVPSVLIEGTSKGQDFNGDVRKQRSALLETSIGGVKTVFGCAGTVFETVQGASGFCFAFDVASSKIASMLALTAGEGAGVWMGGQGIIADAAGSLYLTTGNGDFDGMSQWGESFLKLRYVPPQGGGAGQLKVVDHWTPWTDLARSGQRKVDGTKVAGVSQPSEMMKRDPVGGMTMKVDMAAARLETKLTSRGAPTPIVLVFPPMAQGQWADEDWGSAGPACIFAIHVCIAAGKDGIGYPIDTRSLGGTTLDDLAHPKRNCAKLAAPPVWLTVDPGPVDPCPDDPGTLNFLPNGQTAHLHMTPVQFFDPLLRTWTIFSWGENGQLHKWAVADTGALTYLTQGQEFASSDLRGRPVGGMPGGFCSGASNGNDVASAFLACTVPYGDANANVVNGRLLVYDAAHPAQDGSLQVLWDSQRWGVQFMFNKFNPPVIDGGTIIVPNYSGGVDLYRLTD